MKRSTLTLALSLAFALASLPTTTTTDVGVTSYTLIAKGDTVAVVLRNQNGEANGHISSLRYGNFTAAVVAFFASKNLDPGPRTLHSLGMLLELANGGECDACKTFVEESVLRLVEVQEAKTKEAMEHARANGVDFKALTGMGMDQDFVQREFGNLCVSDRYRRYALHIQAGCQEHLITRNFLKLLHTAANSSTPADLRIPEFKRSLCEVARVESAADGVPENAPAPCPVKGPSPAQLEWDGCRMCAENVQDLVFLLRRTSRNGLPMSGDPMSLNKPKTSSAAPYLGERHLRMAVQDLCSEVGKRHSAGVATDLQEQCEDLVGEYEENLVALADQGAWRTASPGRTICVDVAGLCSRAQYEALEPHLENQHQLDMNQTRRLPQHAIELNRGFREHLAADEARFRERRKSLANATVLEGGPEGRAFGVNYKDCHGLERGSPEMMACIKRVDDEALRGQRNRATGDRIPDRDEV